MRVAEMTQHDIGKRVAWAEGPFMERYGELKAFCPNGELIIKLERPIRRGTKPPFNLVRVPAAQCALVGLPEHA